MSERAHQEARHREVVPMKVNAFEQMQIANTQLAPLFPYLHPGAIVPCSAVFENDPETSRMGYFIHKNSVDEVAIVLGSNSQARTGDAWRGPFEHGVGFDAPVPFFMSMVITQRQKEDGEQPESWALPCSNCNELLSNYHFSGEAEDDERFPPLPTTKGSLEGALITGEDDEALTCKHCGHKNRPFPADVWGWSHYMQNTRVVNKSYKELLEAGQ